MLSSSVPLLSNILLYFKNLIDLSPYEVHRYPVEFIEEKTPYGIVLKVLTKNWNFLAFDRQGGSIYADDAGLKVLHKVPLVTFVGINFRIQNNASKELSFLKVSKNQIIIPYYDSEDHRRKYLFINTLSKLDLVPVRLKHFMDVVKLAREIDSGLKPDYIVVNSKITKNDIVIIKNRYSEANIILAEENRDTVSAEGKGTTLQSPNEQKAVELIENININMMSNNPVFLARVHLRQMELSKVNQIMLDFDLSGDEAEYIMSFIDTMLKKAGDNQDIQKNSSKLQTIRNSLLFYSTLLKRDTERIIEIINAITDNTGITSYMTLITKVKLLYPSTEDQLLFTEFENLMWGKKEQLEKE